MSRVLSGDSTLSVGEETRARVWQAAQETGYLDTRGLSRRKRSRSARVGVVLAPRVNLEHTAYYTVLLEAVQAELANSSFQSVFVLTHGDIAEPSVLYTQVHRKAVDGVIVLGTSPPALLEWVTRQEIALVVVSSNSYVDDGYDRVAVDHLRSAAKAVAHLVARGCRRIAYLGPTDGTLRYEGFLNGMRKVGLESLARLTWRCSWDVGSAHAATAQALEAGERPDGLFAASDELAIGAFRALQQAGVRVPEDMRLVGHDDQLLMAYMSPALTTVHVPLREMGQVAVRLLAERLSGVRDYPAHAFLPTEVIVRESCGEPM